MTKDIYNSIISKLSFYYDEFEKDVRYDWSYPSKEDMLHTYMIDFASGENIKGMMRYIIKTTYEDFDQMKTEYKQNKLRLLRILMHNINILVDKGALRRMPEK